MIVPIITKCRLWHYTLQHIFTLWRTILPSRQNPLYICIANSFITFSRLSVCLIVWRQYTHVCLLIWQQSHSSFLIIHCRRCFFHIIGVSDIIITIISNKIQTLNLWIWTLDTEMILFKQYLYTKIKYTPEISTMYNIRTLSKNIWNVHAFFSFDLFMVHIPECKLRTMQ